MNQKRGRAPSAEFEVTIEKLVYGGAGLGRHAGKVVFVPFSAPGDRLIVRAIEQKKNYIRATIVRTVQSGPGRTTAPCTHFGRCGGCQWQHIEYERQVEIKRQILEEVVHHHFPETRELPIVMKAAPQPYGYRSRARIQVRGFSTDTTAGFYRFESHAIEDVQTCPLFRPALNEALNSVRETRMRAATDPGNREVALACSEEDSRWSAAEVDPAQEESSSGVGKPEPHAQDGKLLRRKAAGFEYVVSPDVFFQANDFMLEELVSEVRNLTADSGCRAALDLYCGVGLFTLPLAGRFKEVVAVESSAHACRLCEQNATAARLGNVRVVTADVKSWMDSVNAVASPGFDLILLDPPRAGAGSAIMELITQWAPETILYVACDPQTLCRDVGRLPSRDYRIDFVQGLDLFPQTYHYETIMRVRRRRP